MARIKPNIEAPETIEVRKDQEYITQVREYRLITPLFGGGVDPGEADPVTVVRASEIRGQLRFWWRATRGGQFGGKLEDMKAAEDALWGAASKKEYERPSLVQITIEALSKPEAFKPIDRYGAPAPHVGHPRSRHSYAAFPLNDKKGEIQTNIHFRLMLRYPKQDTVIANIQTALWAWETFGGIGARTRRGLGAISLADTQQLPTTAEFPEYLFNKIVDTLITEGKWDSDIPHIAGDRWRYVIVTPGDDVKWRSRLREHNDDDALAMWDFLLERLRDFRQDRPRIGARFGRSYWPEADSLREHLRTWANYTDVQGNVHDHRNPTVILTGTPIQVIPRAVFGLPLIFQFKDSPRTLAKDARQYGELGRTPSLPRDPDPDAVTIEGKAFSRWASPLILRPIRCRDGILGIAVVLHQPVMDGANLLAIGAPGMSVDIALTPAQAKQVRILRGNTNVIESFLKYLKGR